MKLMDRPVFNCPLHSLSCRSAAGTGDRVLGGTLALVPVIIILLAIRDSRES